MLENILIGLFFVGWILAFTGFLSWVFSKIVGKESIKMPLIKYGRYQRDFGSFFLAVTLISLIGSINIGESDSRKANPNISLAQFKILEKSVGNISTFLSNQNNELDIHDFSSELLRPLDCERSICRKVERLAKKLKTLDRVDKSSNEYLDIKKQLGFIEEELNREKSRLNAFCGQE